MERRDFMKVAGITTIGGGVAPVSGAATADDGSTHLDVDDTDDREHARYVNVTCW